MAYSKKVTRRRRYTRRARRYSRRRRYRRKYSRRSGRRFPKNVEVKCMSTARNWTTETTKATISGTDTLVFFPLYVYAIGGDTTSPIYNMTISQGTSRSQRIGAVVKPVKLRITGALSLTYPNTADNTSLQTQLNAYPSFWQVRLLVYQIKGGNSSLWPTDENYHQLALHPRDNDGSCNSEQVKKIISNYVGTWNDVNGQSFNESQWLNNNGLAKCPLRLGIGNMMRVLYNKTFWLTSSNKPVKQFRIVTKVPKKLVYPEHPNGLAGVVASANTNSAIYICWFFQPGNWNPYRNFPVKCNMNVDLFFTDE